MQIKFLRFPNLKLAIERRLYFLEFLLFTERLVLSLGVKIEEL